MNTKMHLCGQKVDRVNTRMSASQRYRLAAETVEEREARLQRMSASKRDRLAAETAEERERPGCSA